MTEITLEQRVLLVAGWFRKTERIIKGLEHLRDKDLPPGYVLPRERFLDRQRLLVNEAATSLENRIVELRLSYSDEAAIDTYKFSKVSEEAHATNVSPGSTSQTIGELSRKLTLLKEKKEQCDMLLRILHGEEETALPNLPLYQYALAWERFNRADHSARSEDVEENKSGTVFRNAIRPQRAFETVKRMEHSDKIALAAAVLISVFILLGGYLYVYSWGRLHMDIQMATEGVFTITFTNSFGETVGLHAPHTGNRPPADTLKYFGVSVEASDKDGNTRILDEIDAHWIYKDQPGHLYGPIIISPLSSEEVSLHLSQRVLETPVNSLRIILYKSPNRPYASETISMQ